MFVSFYTFHLLVMIKVQKFMFLKITKKEQREEGREKRGDGRVGKVIRLEWCIFFFHSLLICNCNNTWQYPWYVALLQDREKFSSLKKLSAGQSHLAFFLTNTYQQDEIPLILAQASKIANFYLQHKNNVVLIEKELKERKLAYLGFPPTYSQTHHLTVYIYQENLEAHKNNKRIHRGRIKHH